MLSSVGKVPGEEELMKIITSSVPLDRMGNPDEIAKAVTFLASDDVDGGRAQV
jgi:NAD(P)-dependent dehydrogenase (short-subunit alcohol dehydrogenase family)